MGSVLCHQRAGEGAGAAARGAAARGAAAQVSAGAARLEVPGGCKEGESRKRGSAEDGNMSEAPVGSILSQRMRGGREELRRSGAARKGPSRTADPASRRDGAELQHVPACPRTFSCVRV